MIKYFISVVFSYSVGLAALTGLIRFKKILKSYRPFVYILCLAFISEILSTISTLLFRNNILITDMYILAEAFLFVWLFHGWGALQFRKWHYSAMLFFLGILWVCDIFFLHKLASIVSLFHVCYSFILIFLAIDQVNQLIVQEHGNILRSSKFLICAGIIIFYTYNATIEVFFLVHLEASNTFYRNVYLIMEFVNLFVNLIYALAALWIPTKQRFMQSS